MKKIFTFLILFLSVSAIRAQSTEDYIAEHVGHAQELMRLYQLPASLILGVAIHESAAGKSKIAKYLNNHFGVKGNNTNTEINSAYRDYPTADSSYNHFISFLHSRPYFNVLFGKYDQYDFMNWAKGIQKGGYAHSKTWSKQVIALIKKYELFKYDERPIGYADALTLSPVLPATSTVVKRTSALKREKTTQYVVKRGDNLNGIAKKLGTTAATLMKRNSLKSAALQPGQKINYN
jgi:hypothetical protein